MSGVILSVIARFTLIATGIGVCFASPENTSPNQRDTESPVFLQQPPYIQYYVTRKQSANLTWVATNVCEIKIKCDGKNFQAGVRGKSCRSFGTMTKTKIVTVADFPNKTKSIACKCRVWGKKDVRQSDLIVVDKAFLRPDFGTVELHHVLSPNTTVVLKCRPPKGSPRPNITWHKNGKPSLLLGHDGRRRIRLNSKKNLVIERVQMGDSGEYHCVARNMAATRVGPVMKLDVRENMPTADCQEHQLPCTNQYSPECQSGSNRSLNCESPMLVVWTQHELYTTNLLNMSIWRRIVAKNIVSLDFGLNPNLIYWTEGNRIKRFSMHHGVSKDMPFGLDDAISVKDLAVDWRGDKIYWIDAIHAGIYIGDLQSGRKVKIIDKNLDSPGAIVVSHSEGYIYWTDWDRTAKIERARLDGSERGVFISDEIHIPNGLALDESDKKLYWAGKDFNGYGIIEALSFHGLNRKVIFRRPGYHPFSLDIFQDFVYWSDWEKNAVLRINKTGGGGDEVIVRRFNKPRLKILHRRKESGVNPCERSNGECEHLCVHLPSLGSRCLCEENFQLNKNGKTCDKLELGGEDNNKSGPNNPGGPSLVEVLLIAILVLAVMGLIILLLKKRCPCQTLQDPPRMVRRSTNPDDEDDNSDESLELTDQSELGRVVSEPSKQDVGESSGSVPACGDSLVTSPRTCIHLEIEHGGFAIVGDDAKINLHRSPQS